MLTPNVEEVFGRQVQALPRSARDLWCQEAFEHWRLQGFPYPQMTRAEKNRELALLQAQGNGVLRHVLRSPSMVGLRTANSFHPQMWSARVRGKSPLECFNHDEILQRCLVKGARVWRDRRCWAAYNVRILVSIQNRGRVANFRPTVARAILQSVSSERTRVLDFSAGYGGRLLGAMSLGCQYVGIDPEPAQCVGLRAMMRSFAGVGEVVQGCAEDVLPLIKSRSVDVVFSSPPYFRLERYSRHPLQSAERYPTYASWRECFLEPVLRHSWRILRPGGFLIVNVANLPDVPLADDFRRLCSRLCGAAPKRLTMNMSTNPAAKARTGSLLRSEPIFMLMR